MTVIPPSARVVLCSVFPLLEWSFVLANDDMSGGSRCVQGLRKELEGGGGAWDF